MDSSGAEEELLDSRQTSDDVIRGSQAKIGIGGVRCDHQQLFGVCISYANHFQAVELMLIYEAGVVGLHTYAYRSLLGIDHLYRSL